MVERIYGAALVSFLRSGLLQHSFNFLERAIKASVVDSNSDNHDAQHPIVSAVCPPAEMERLSAEPRRQFRNSEALAADDSQLEVPVGQHPNDSACAAGSSSEN